MKLYRSAIKPELWVAYGPEMGWAFFPMKANGREPTAGAGLGPGTSTGSTGRLAAQNGMPAETPHMPLPYAA
jgi:hypothetical protein